MTGVAHLARLSNDEGKRQDCLRLWKNMAQRQLYITGGIGSQSSGEALAAITIYRMIRSMRKAALQSA